MVGGTILPVGTVIGGGGTTPFPIYRGGYPPQGKKGPTLPPPKGKDFGYPPGGSHPPHVGPGIQPGMGASGRSDIGPPMKLPYFVMPEGTVLPIGIRVIVDPGGHITIAPDYDMPWIEYQQFWNEIRWHILPSDE